MLVGDRELWRDGVAQSHIVCEILSEGMNILLTEGRSRCERWCNEWIQRIGEPGRRNHHVCSRGCVQRNQDCLR